MLTPIQVQMCVPGRVFHRGLAGEDPYKHPDVKVGADGEQRPDVALVDRRPLIQTVEDDPKGLGRHQFG